MQQGIGRPFVFTATGSAYFRIWIVNLLLSIVTIGFYSPWAKVRRIRYFYGNTLFDGSPFEFHGRPIALLKGRVIGLVLLVAYTQTSKFSFTLWVIVVAALFALFPWLLWKSLRFRLGNTSYRGVRFGFDGTVAEAYLTFVPLMLLVLGPTFVLVVAQHALGVGSTVVAFKPYFIAIGLALLLAPWFYFRLRAYQHRHARLGATPFTFAGRVRTAYWIAVKTFLLGLLFLLIGALAGGLVGFPVWIGLKAVGVRSAPLIGTYVGFVIGYLVLLSSAFSLQAFVQNFVWAHSRLGDAPFDSQVSVSTLWRIQCVNVVLTVLTAGFFWPFAVVRTMRYRIQVLSWSGDSDGLLAGTNDAKVGATGEEAADLFGLDLAL